jgi:hypothetical protein
MRVETKALSACKWPISIGASSLEHWSNVGAKTIARLERLILVASLTWGSLNVYVGGKEISQQSSI